MGEYNPNEQHGKNDDEDFKEEDAAEDDDERVEIFVPLPSTGILRDKREFPFRLECLAPTATTWSNRGHMRRKKGG